MLQRCRTDAEVCPTGLAQMLRRLGAIAQMLRHVLPVSWPNRHAIALLFPFIFFALYSWS